MLLVCKNKYLHATMSSLSGSHLSIKQHWKKHCYTPLLCSLHAILDVILFNPFACKML